jgi:hypothetical protein
VDCILESVTVDHSDILFIEMSGRSIISERCIEGAAIFVVEIISPSSGGTDRRRKPQLYAQYAVPYYWIIDPPGELSRRISSRMGCTDGGHAFRDRDSLAPALT